MKDNYLKYYRKHSVLGGLHFLWDAFTASNNLRKLSFVNRQKDYTELLNEPGLMALHLALNQHLLDGIKFWNSYDYGEGYFYQSFNKIHIRGFRNTEARVSEMQLSKVLSGKKVLEIGCNTGFLTLSVADYCISITGFDPAEHLINIAKETAQYLNVKNALFEVNSFENFSSTDLYDIVLSFANHSTFDGNTQQTLSSYFDKCLTLLKPGGLFLFESHPPEHEKDQLPMICNFISERFEIQLQEVLVYGSFLDQNRTFIIAKKQI